MYAVHSVYSTEKCLETAIISVRILHVIPSSIIIITSLAHPASRLVLGQYNLQRHRFPRAFAETCQSLLSSLIAGLE